MHAQSMGFGLRRLSAHPETRITSCMRHDSSGMTTRRSRSLLLREHRKAVERRQHAAARREALLELGVSVPIGTALGEQMPAAGAAAVPGWVQKLHAGHHLALCGIFLASSSLLKYLGMRFRVIVI